VGPTRRDAVRNRKRILEAAATVFAEQGLEASMDTVATTAGVGVGTVYRHFPRREELAAALFDDRLDQVVDMLHEAESDPDAWHGLTRFLQQTLELEVSDRALSQVLGDPVLRLRLMRRGSEDIRPVVDGLVARAQRAGQLREDAEPTDLGLVRAMVIEVALRTRASAPEIWRRMLALCLDGLRPGSREPLPGAALTSAQAAEVHAWPRST
jgi:AcrR family transcriptional regulator